MPLLLLTYKHNHLVLTYLWSVSQKAYLLLVSISVHSIAKPAKVTFRLWCAFVLHCRLIQKTFSSFVVVLLWTWRKLFRKGCRDCLLCFAVVISQGLNTQGSPEFFLGDTILQLVSGRRFVQIWELVVSQMLRSHLLYSNQWVKLRK